MIILRAIVIKEWRIHENGKLEKNTIIKAFLARITERFKQRGGNKAKLLA